METTTLDEFKSTPYTSRDFYIGLGLAISSTIFIGTSFIVKKLALLRLAKNGILRAGSGGFGYLKEWLWWMGFLMMGVGELANFAAYAFAPASLVTPLGALSVLVSAILASKYLNEKLNFLGKVGCLLCILGSTVVVLHSPKEEEVESLDILLNKLQEPLFIIYVNVVIVASLAISFYFGPKYGHKYIVIYIILCSAVGSLTVMSCKGLGLALKDTISGKSNDFNNWLTYAFFIMVCLCISIQMNYLNKALDLFNTSIVTPVYYVFFTTLVIIASAILFKEWVKLSFKDVLGNVCGFFTIVIAIFLLHAFKDIDITLSDVKGSLRPKSNYLSRNSKHYNYESLLSRSV
ncbi:magnesium transporter NIPA2 [Onthophagus taurus]|uniref:magnesium transporter NIPA2 n=1 Tax=Onthophagus taurus TaxID=166361 RepID=UPI000C1FDF64|nr:magnesium transporter NIPA2 [Onthophagus taurus]